MLFFYTKKNELSRNIKNIYKTPSCEKPTLIHTMKKTHSVFIELRSKGAKRAALLKKVFRKIIFMKNRILLCKSRALSWSKFDKFIRVFRSDSEAAPSATGHK